MRSWMISYVAGIFIALHQSSLIPLSGCTFIALLVLGLCLKRTEYTGLLVMFCTGLLWATLWGHWQLAQRMPQSAGKSDWHLTGQVVNLPQQDAELARFNLAVDQARPVSGQSHFVPEKVRLSWYQPAVKLVPGQQLQLVARLKPPHGSLNLHGFDYEHWLLERGINATGYVRELQQQKKIMGSRVDRWRQQLNQQLNHRFGDNRASALLKALVTGDKQALGSEDWQGLRQTGTVHLAVISGLHIGFMALIGWFLGRLISLLPGLNQQRCIPLLAALSLAGFYMLLAGASLPTQRAYLMLAVLLLSSWRLFHISPWTRWWLAMAVVLTLSPIAIFSAGFWLSFGVVAILLWCYSLQQKGFSLVRLQLLILVAMLPMYLLFFAGFSLLAPLINLVAIPFISLLLVVILLDQFLYLLGLDFMTVVLLGLVRAFWWLIAQASDLPFSYWLLPAPDWPLLVLGAFGVSLWLLPAGWRFRLLGLLMLLPLLLPRTMPVGQGRFTAHVFDVGQGLAVWVSSGDYDLLYDLGPAYRSGDSAFDWNILPVLRAEGIRHIDTLILSHDDNDHAGGYSALTEHYQPGSLFASYPLTAREAQHCRAGQQWQVNGISFRFLAGSEGRSDNERSCVLLIDNGHCSLLLTGDIDARGERRLGGPKRPVTWLLAAHHGSRFSSDPLFLNAWQPRVIIFSAGFANPFNHPHPDVLLRAEQIQARSLVTSRTGAITLSALANGDCSEQVLRQQEPRFWR